MQSKGQHSPSCPVCGSHEVSRKMHKFFANTLWQCPSCRLIFVWPQPTILELKNIYNETYFKNTSSSTYGYDDYLLDRKNIMRTAARRLVKVCAYRPKKGLLLDIGCAMGFFVETALENGWDAHGLDISEHATEIAKKNLGKRVLCGAMRDGIYPEEHFDVITLWDTIEHIADPMETLALCRKYLKSGGLLAVATPDAQSIVARIAGDNWMGYKDAEHLFYFSRRALRSLLEKNGFAVKDMRLTGKHVKLDLFAQRLLLYSKILSHAANAVIRRLAISDISFYINPFDIVTVYAQKT